MLTGNALIRAIGLCVVAGLLVAGFLFPAVGAVGMASNQATDTVNNVSSDLVQSQVPLVSTITDKDGVPIAYVFDQNRFNTPPQAIADTMKAAIISIEDRRFFEHNGVDWRGTARAVTTNLTASGSALEGQGASTLTMQYVKNYLLYAVARNDAERAAAVESSPARKLREVRVALQLEKQLSKDEILARYLNIVFFGHNTYGVAAAARTYFNTTPDRLTISQAALLAGMVRSPSTYDPTENPEQALARRNVVIAEMANVGSITPEQAAAGMAEPLGIQRPLTGLTNGCVGAGPADGFYCQYTLDYLAAAGFTEEKLRRGGYLIRTNLDRRASDLAKRAANAEVPTQTRGIANAMAIVEPGRERHAVRALVANRDYGLDADAGQTSYALPSLVQGFGAGSIYKIFTAAAMLERGMGIENPVPVTNSYTSRVFKNEGRAYSVGNAGDYRNGSVSLQTALAISPNTTFVALEDRLGSIDPVVNMAYRLGMRDSLMARDAGGRTIADAVKQEKRGSYTLGPEPTSPLDLANVAATLMSGGKWCPPTPLDAVLDRNGAPVKVPEPPCEQAVPEGLANSLAVGLSKDDQPGGTAFAAAKAVNWTRPMLGKTGTTTANRSAGFVGATPQYAGAVLVWPDGSRPSPICDTDPPRLCGNGNIFGGKVPARTWFNAMVPMHEGLPVAPLPPTEPRYVTGGGTPVPDVVGQGGNSAQLTLERAGFRVNRETSESDAPAGTVASQSTRTAMPGDTVTIVISTGPPRRRATPVFPSPQESAPDRPRRSRESESDRSNSDSEAESDRERDRERDRDRDRDSDRDSDER
ncbi:MAG: penicillin-binding protein [Actinomycetota bacterium]|nr:penicillin-binding protein [Actinomycetota bacterium]